MKVFKSTMGNSMGPSDASKLRIPFSSHGQVKEERGRGLPLSLQSLQGSSTVDSGKLVLMLLGSICACFVTLKRNQLTSHGGDHRVSHNEQRARHAQAHNHTCAQKQIKRGGYLVAPMLFLYICCLQCH